MYGYYGYGWGPAWGYGFGPGRGYGRGRMFGRGNGWGARLGYCPWTGMPRGWRWYGPQAYPYGAYMPYAPVPTYGYGYTYPYPYGVQYRRDE